MEMAKQLLTAASSLKPMPTFTVNMGSSHPCYLRVQVPRLAGETGGVASAAPMAPRLAS
jgi:hypothetical protein